MPVFFSERLPVPTVKSYCGVSLLLFVASLVFAKNIQAETTEADILLYNVILEEPFCLWSLINMAFCGLFLFGKLIQHVVLGELRSTEEQHIQDKFWNFIFYKMIFVFGVINVQTLHEMLCWSAWFSMLGFFHILGQMSKDRFEYVTASPTTPRRIHIKLFCLIVCIFFSSIVLAAVSVYVGLPQGISVFAFMMEESILLGLKSLFLLSRYAIRLFDLVQTNKWDQKAKLVYYLHLCIELSYYGLDLVYHFHMLLWSNVFLSLASLVLYWNMQSLIVQIRKIIKRHNLFKKILRSVDLKFPIATQEEIDSFEDHCAICWDDMEQARKLPCGHLFHHTCLCSWLQQDISCPTCRRSLSSEMGISHIALPQQQQNNDMIQNEIPNIVNADNENANEGGFRNYFFYLDGQQIANWFPSLSIEVFHGRIGDQEQEINNMGEQLFAMFPDVSHEVILEDLRRTRSIDATAENILDGTLAQIPSDEAAPRNETNTPQDSTEENSNETQSPPEQATDNESVIEESSEEEEQNNTPETEIENSKSRVCHAVSTGSAAVRKRQLIPKRTISRNSSSSSNASAENNVRTDLEERRSILLNAIDRRNGNAQNDAAT